MNTTIKILTNKITFVTLLSLFSITVLLLIQKNTHAEEITVYKSPSCGCCNKWVKHMEKNGFTVTSHNLKDVQPIKNQLGIPNQMRSCHTAKVGNYLVEGHVPADLVKKMLKEKPSIKGLSVPGMVMGSPGMEGHRKDPYQVVSFDEQGQFKVFASR